VILPSLAFLVLNGNALVNEKPILSTCAAIAHFKTVHFIPVISSSVNKRIQTRYKVVRITPGLVLDGWLFKISPYQTLREGKK